MGIAISEAVEIAAADEQSNYALGSVLNHVLLHQTVIGQEALVQMEMAGDYPDLVIGCTGESKVILFNFCGHGHFDMQAYMDYQAGKLVDTEYSAAEVAMALAGLPSVI